MMRYIIQRCSDKSIFLSMFRLLPVSAILVSGCVVSSPQPKSLKPYISAGKLYALQKPADWNVVESSAPDLLQVRAQSPEGASAVEFRWERNGQGRVNAAQYLLAYRQILRKTWPDVSFTKVRASADQLRCTAEIAFHTGKTAVQGRYYFESSPQSLSLQGYYAPNHSLASSRSLLVNIMSSLAFLKKDPKPEGATKQVRYYQPLLRQRSAADRSLTITIPADWDFMAAGGKVVTGSPKSAPGFIFTSLQGNPMARNAPISSGVLAARYMNPQQTLQHVLQAFGHQDVRVGSSSPDPASVRELAATTGSRGEAQDITAYWTSSQGLACVGGFKVINTLPSMTGLWTTIISGIWAPEKETYLYLDTLEKVASSFAINGRYAREYIQAGMQRLRAMERDTANKINDLNSEREKNLQDWEKRQRMQEFSQSKWDDYRRGQSYWVSDIEGGKVYATDSRGTRDTVTGDYYEGRPFNYSNFEGENPRYNESMREISSYELERMGNR